MREVDGVGHGLAGAVEVVVVETAGQESTSPDAWFSQIRWPYSNDVYRALGRFSAS